MAGCVKTSVRKIQLPICGKQITFSKIILYKTVFIIVRII